MMALNGHSFRKVICYPVPWYDGRGIVGMKDPGAKDEDLVPGTTHLRRAWWTL